MDNALLSPMDMNAAPADGFGSRFAALPGRSKMMMALGVMALMAVLVAMSMWNSQGDYRPVFTGLSDKDGGAIITQLSAMNVPYRNEPGGTILVPASQVYDVRMKLASAGLPKGSVIGFELMDKQSIGQTQFNERLNFQRGLEGELTRTITALADVADARVHLAMPQQNGFFREQQKPSASVMLTLHGGRTLDRAQVAGIVHLVSASVPELSPKAVSVLDQSGSLLSSTSDTGSGLDSQQLQYKQQIEANFSKRIYELLEPVVGRDNLRATVTAEVDFSQTEATSEEFKPNQGANASASIRSLQSTESSNGSGGTPSGVPGATSNQPPSPATAPINGAAAPLQAAQGLGANINSRKDNTTNFEIDKTVRVTRNATGVVKRLNAAVVLNNRVITDAKGKTSTQPLAPEEIEKLTALVKETMGFDEARGDSVKLINTPFKIEKIDVLEVPFLQQPWLIDMVRAGAVPASLVLVALIAVFGMVRPAIRAAMLAPPASEKGHRLDAVVDEGNHLPSPVARPTLQAPESDPRMDVMRAMAKENPAAVANVVRGWVNGEAT